MEVNIMLEINQAIARINAVNTNLVNSHARIVLLIESLRNASPTLTPAQEAVIVEIEATAAKVAVLAPETTEVVVA